MTQSQVVLLFLLSFIFLITCCSGQLSKPISDPTQIPKNKFNTNALITLAEQNMFVLDHSDLPDGIGWTKQGKQTSQCYKNLQVYLLYKTEVGSSIYSTPLLFYDPTPVSISSITPNWKQLQQQNSKIIVPTFIKYLEMLEGKDGSEANRQGFPFQHYKFSSHSSVQLYDIDKDGKEEIVSCTSRGAEIVFFRVDNAKILQDYTIKIQPLKIQKDWYKGLDTNQIKATMNLQETEKQSETTSPTSRKVLQVKEPKQKESSTVKKEIGVNVDLSTEAAEAMNLIYTPLSMRGFTASEEESKEFNPFFANDYQEILQQTKESIKAKNEQGKYVFVDAHILSNPVIVDLDQDGKDEIIIAVSYYFDREYYSHPEHLSKLDVDIALDKYVAGGCIVYELESRKLKWEAHLDLTTDTIRENANIYSSPTVVDLDGDGNLEVIIATNLGFIYVLDKHGQPKPGFPVQMGQIEATVVTEDVNNDGDLELCVGDFNSNFACFDPKGKVLWEKRIVGYPVSPAVIGDVNEDGILDLVFGTSEGQIYALRGTDGVALDGFPISLVNKNIEKSVNKIPPSIYSPISLVKMDHQRGLNLVFTSFDGYLYIINSFKDCILKVDIGEKSYSQVLIGDLIRNGKLNLIVSTMNGNIYTYGTTLEERPLRRTLSGLGYENGYTYREKLHGIYVLDESRTQRDVVGNNFKIQFKIIDYRRIPHHIVKQYRVKVKIGNRYTLLDKVYDKPGIKAEILNLPNERMHGVTISVEMTNEKQQKFTDSYQVSFNIGFLTTLKWFLLLPFVLLSTMVIWYLQKVEQNALDQKEDILFQ